MDDELKRCLGQIIDLQMAMNAKLDNLIQVESNLFNTLAKYDVEYQKEIARENGGL